MSYTLVSCRAVIRMGRTRRVPDDEKNRGHEDSTATTDRQSTKPTGTDAKRVELSNEGSFVAIGECGGEDSSLEENMG